MNRRQKQIHIVRICTNRIAYRRRNIMTNDDDIGA